MENSRNSQWLSRALLLCLSLLVGCGYGGLSVLVFTSIEESMRRSNMMFPRCYSGVTWIAWNFGDGDYLYRSHFVKGNDWYDGPGHREIPRVEGKAWSEPGSPPADPPAQLDKVPTSPQDPHNPYFHFDLVSEIFAFASIELVFETLPRVCKSLRDFLLSSSFLEIRARRYLVEPNSLAPLVFYEQDSKLSLMGYDSGDLNRWIRSSPFPCPLFSNNTKSVAGHVGLLCVFVKGPNGAGMHFAYNPLTQNQRELPPMKFPRPPYVTNLHVTVAENRYQVIAIGSQASGTHSRKTEIYDSTSNQWTDAEELPEGYSIDIQTGGYLEGCLYCIASRGQNGCKVVLVLDVENLRWLEPIILLPHLQYIRIVQLLQCNGAIYLFFEHDSTHFIYRLNPGSEGGYTWTTKVNKKFVKKEPSSKYTCVPIKGKQGTKLGIFKNSCAPIAVNERLGWVYDITADETEITATSAFLRSPPFASEDTALFHPENPVGYSFEPSFFVDA